MARPPSPGRTACTMSSGSAARKAWPRRSWPASTRALKLGADYIVNTDADNQYAGHQHRAAAARRCSPAQVRHRDWRSQHPRDPAHVVAKKLLQRFGSWAVRQVSGTEVPDTTSGFRAYTREAALQMTIVSEFSYTLESIIQAGKKRMAIAHVEIATNADTRPSRLFDSMFGYIKRSGATIVRIYTMYEPLKVFTLHRHARVRGRAVLVGCGSFTTYLIRAVRTGNDSVADPRGRADDRGLPGRAHRPCGGRRFRQPQAAGRRALPVRTMELDDTHRRDRRSRETGADGRAPARCRS